MVCWLFFLTANFYYFVIPKINSTMHPYLPHLVADIKAAHRINKYSAKSSIQTIENNFEEVMHWMDSEEPQHTFGYFCGLESVNFPPTNQLSLKDMKIVCEAFHEMMFSWNLDIDLPEKLPLPLAYKILVNTLNSKTNIVDNGFISMDSCPGYAPDCIFKEYCPCLDVWHLFEDEESPNDLPDDELLF